MNAGQHELESLSMLPRMYHTTERTLTRVRLGCDQDRTALPLSREVFPQTTLVLGGGPVTFTCQIALQDRQEITEQEQNISKKEPNPKTFRTEQNKNNELQNLYVPTASSINAFGGRPHHPRSVLRSVRLR
jgi:hypothetical protein